MTKLADSGRDSVQKALRNFKFKLSWGFEVVGSSSGYDLNLQWK